jgi:hypothetical protein
VNGIFRKVATSPCALDEQDGLVGIVVTKKMAEGEFRADLVGLRAIVGRAEVAFADGSAKVAGVSKTHHTFTSEQVLNALAVSLGFFSNEG